MIQIRNVPTQVHRKLKARAALAGMSMSEFILREITKIVERPTTKELMARIEKSPRRDPDPSPTQILRRERERG